MARGRRLNAHKLFDDRFLATDDAAVGRYYIGGEEMVDWCAEQLAVFLQKR